MKAVELQARLREKEDYIKELKLKYRGIEYTRYETSK
tara:strand:- start:166 stop:276 length:111 start_codon:yes stop_codon:yes gene_type:complete